MPRAESPDNRLLAIDVGGGTQDILLWDPEQPVENAVKMILPAPTQICARRIGRLTAQRHDLFLTGRLMGGGAVSRAVRRHLALGLKVYARENAARTLHDDVERVRALGVEITEAPPPAAHPVTLGDVDLASLKRALREFEVTLPRRYALAVQDHGFSPHASNRRFRFQHWEDFLARGGDLRDLAYYSPPPYLTRMEAAVAALPGAVVMDTCAAGIRGALLDPQAQEHLPAGLVVVNLGNEHTFAALVKDQRLYGIYEHHTGLLTPAKLADHLTRFQEGRLTNAEVFADSGHGCALSGDYPPGRLFSPLVITGPQRRLARGFPAIFAAPGGDMMLSGCFGLLAAHQDKADAGR